MSMFHIDGSQCIGRYKPEDMNDPESAVALVPGTCTHPHHGNGPYPFTPPPGFKAKGMSMVNKHAPTCVCNRPYGNVGKCDCGLTPEAVPYEMPERNIRKRGFERIYGTTVLGCGCGIPWSKAHNRYSDALICETHGITTIAEFR